MRTLSRRRHLQHRGFGTVTQNCEVRNYIGDEIRFQQSNDVTIAECRSENSTQLGFHPGRGSQRLPSSPLDALMVGARIEEMDIADLKRLLPQATNPQLR